MESRLGSMTAIPRPAPFGHVYVATDFSLGAANALARAAWLPLSKGGRITVVHVLADHMPQKGRADAEKFARKHLDDAMRAISRTTSETGRRDVKVSAELCGGRSYVEIIRHARSDGADLIVVGRHRHRPVRDLFIGPTADRVIRAGDLPVLVVVRMARDHYRHPIVAVDLEDTCRSVVITALRVLGREVKSATIVHAYHVPFEGFITPGAAPGELTGLRRQYKQAAVSEMSKLQARIGDLGIRWQSVVVNGEHDVASAVLGQLIRSRADLLAVGTHGRSGVSHALIGSVAECLIQAAACDVLVARPARVSFKLP